MSRTSGVPDRPAVASPDSASDGRARSPEKPTGSLSAPSPAQRDPPPASPVSTDADRDSAPGDLDPLQRELLLEEALALRDVIADPERRSRYDELAAAVEAGSVPEHLTDALQDLLELGLETGRFRRRYTAEGEQALLGLYRRTPRGAGVQERVAAANEALGALRGRVLQSVAFTAKGPGAYGLAIATDSGRVTLRIAREGVWVESVEVEA